MKNSCIILNIDVGKTCFMTQFFDNPEVMSETSPTTSASARTIYLELDKRYIALKVIDSLNCLSDWVS